MNCARIFGMLVLVLALILPSFGQDAKKDAKDAKAAGDKKPATKAAKDKKTADKKKDKTKPKEEEVNPADKVSYGQVVTGKLKQIDANSQRDFTVTLMLPDAKKIIDVNVWATQNIAAYQQQQLVSQLNQQRAIATANSVQARQQAVFAYQKSLGEYNVTLTQRQIQLAQKMETEIYSPKDYELRAAEKIKVRTATPPAEYDDKGNMKRWTVKDLKNLRKGSKLPGYPAEYDALRPSQTVAVYLAKPVLPQAKNTKKGIKLEGIKLDEDKEAGADRPEVVMIVVVVDALPER